jgi:2-methylcitrate dehydratase PrpD
MNSLSLSLIEQAAQHIQRPIEKLVRTKSRLHLLDWLACVAGARQSSMAEIQRGLTDHSLWDRAVWLGNILEMDDVHRAAILHPGPIIWPAALGGGSGKLTTDAPADGDDLDLVLDAAIRGYEAMILIGSTFDARHYAYWHNTATAGLFGAAACSASLMGANDAQLSSALGLAGSVTGGLWQMRHEAVMAKQWHLAHAVTSGRQAALQAMAGVTGPRFILEGPQGLFAASCDAPKPMDLTQDWAIHAVSFKPWGACRHAHPAIDAALELQARGQLTGHVRVATYRDALVFCDRPNPQSVIDAKFSLQHVVAIVMERGVPRLEDFEPDAIAALADARAQVQVVEDAALTDAYPHHFGARIESETGAVHLADTLGDPERPLSDDGVKDKARALMQWGGIDAAAAEDAIATVMETDRRSDILTLLGRIL